MGLAGPWLGSCSEGEDGPARGQHLEHVFGHSRLRLWDPSHVAGEAEPLAKGSASPCNAPASRCQPHEARNPNPKQGCAKDHMVLDPRAPAVLSPLPQRPHGDTSDGRCLSGSPCQMPLRSLQGGPICRALSGVALESWCGFWQGGCRLEGAAVGAFGTHALT